MWDHANTLQWHRKLGHCLSTDGVKKEQGQDRTEGVCMGFILYYRLNVSFPSFQGVGKIPLNKLLPTRAGTGFTVGRTYYSHGW